jgi:hypothetical protein
MADISTIDLALRSEQSVPLSQTQNDNNLTYIETAVNAALADVNVLRRHGEMYQNDNATTTGTLTADTWTHYNFGTIASEHTKEVTFDVSTGTITCPTDGDYRVTIAVAFSGTTTNTVYFAPGVGDGVTQVAQSQHQIPRKLGSSDIGALAVVGVVTVTAGQKIGLMIKQDATQAVTVSDFTLSVQGVPS